MNAAPVTRITAGLLLAACVVSCAPQDSTPAVEPGQAAAARGADHEAGPVLDAALDELAALADSIDRILLPVPLLTPAQENALRRFSNEQQLERARTLGVRPRDTAHVRELIAAGRLVELEDSTALWAVRRLDYSEPLLTPDAHVLLTRIAERFQARLERMGLPPYRVEVTSALRTPEMQEALRRVNPNAALGESTHQYATTLDIAYSSFAAPQDAGASLDTSGAPWLEPRMDRIAAAVLESAAARKSRELQAILGLVLLELQANGDVMVTLERQQPVYHFTVARPLATASDLPSVSGLVSADHGSAPLDLPYSR